jgi:hypothetical protein
MDMDGDIDVAGAAQLGRRVAWWENTDGSGTSWEEHLVDGDFTAARSVCTADIDQDGSTDIVGGGGWIPSSSIVWWDLTPESGVLESSILDTQAWPEWDYLEWQCQTPGGTTLGIQVRSSADHASMGAWSDMLYSPTILSGILSDGDTFFQYRVVMESQELYLTPVLYELMITWDQTGVEGGEDPATTALLPISPNPSVRPTVRFILSEQAFVKLSVFDLSGHLVLETAGAEYGTGHHSIQLDELTPGIYLCRMMSGDFSATRRFVVIE